jgi:hypothetical protein
MVSARDAPCGVFLVFEIGKDLSSPAKICNPLHLIMKTLD